MTSPPQAEAPSVGPGSLGARLTGDGATFAVASLVAERVELCLFDADGRETRVELAASDGGIWHAAVDGVRAGQRYGFRVHGPYEPELGVWCNPAKLLVDPYARAIDGTVVHSAGLQGFSGEWATRSEVDSAPLTQRSIVVDDGFDWGDDDAVRPHHEWGDTVIYELHVKGATMCHPSVPEAMRGTFCGLGHDAVVEHLVSLGVTSVELLPVHESVDEPHLADLGLTNYWGYNSIGFFAPAQRLSAAVRAHDAGGQVTEFKAMVAALHRAGIEVILDVVYNHTAESDANGPELCFRGFDSPAYYRHGDDHALADTTGCGNSINSASPIALGLVLDSLRYWAGELHVDGFRFDLAPTLARPDGRFTPAAPFLSLCAQDPVLRGVKLIAEPWDVGEDDSYALGQFPPPFREWNGRFRDDVRDFWRSEDATLSRLATRFAGSSDLYFTPGRSPTSSVNFITAHDGFTLADLVSFDAKHNEANGEANADGTDDNRSWNCGAEGPSDDAAVRALRARQARGLLATLLLSCGVPMLLAGDELGRTQRGNNNAYCQDNELTWIDWANADAELLAFTTRLIRLRRDHPVFRRRRFLSGRAVDELEWFAPTGEPMAPSQWEDPAERCVAIYLDARGAGVVDAEGAPLTDDDFVVLVNGYWEQVDFRVPKVSTGAFVTELETFEPSRASRRYLQAATVHVAPRSITVLRAVARRARTQRA